MSRKKAGLGAGIWVSLVLLVAVFGVVLNVPLVKASGTIYIRADGSIDPSTTPISTVDKVTYTFTDNIYDSIVVERNNIVVNGAGHVLEGNGTGVAISLTGKSNVTINNITIRKYGLGISLTSSSGNTISSNTITNINGDGIYLHSSSSNNNISANTISNNSWYGIFFNGFGDNNNVSANTISNNNYYGIWFFGSSGNSVSSNIITKTNGNGIRLDSSLNNSLSLNTVTNNGGGILLDYSSGNSLSANTIANNSYYGVRLESSSDNSLSSNTITNNNGDGVYLPDSSNNIVSANTIANNSEYGIDLTSSNNSIFHNNFVNNTAQAYVIPEYGNTWDDGYPSGGNYWSDYNGTDQFSGPNQNIPGSDFRGDTPYVIYLNNTDHYPLMKPYETPPPTITILSPENKTYAINTSISLTFIVSESASWMGYSLNTQPNATVTGNTTLPTLSEGWHGVVVYANNTFGKMGASDILYFTVDTTAPTGSVVINNGDSYTTSTSATLTLTYFDAGSGVNQVRYSSDGSTWSGWESASSTKAWSLSLGDGTKTVYYQIKDNAGHISTAYSDTIVLDTSTPRGSIQINNGAAYTNSTTVTLNLIAEDDGSGVSQMCFSNDWGAYTAWEPYATSKSWTLTDGDGEKTVLVKYSDRVGLIVGSYYNITLDMTKPIANAGQNQTVTVNTIVTFNGSGSTDNTGIASYLWDFGDATTGAGVTPTHTYTNVGTYTAKLTVLDLAGNRATSSATVSVTVVIPEFPSALVLTAIVTLLSAFAVAFRRKRAIQTGNL